MEKDEDGLAKLPISMYYDEDVTSDALAPTEIVRMDVAEVLKRKGLLLMEDSRLGHQGNVRFMTFWH